MKNYFNTALNLIFEEKKLEKDRLEKLTQNRNFLNKKNDIFSLLPYKNKFVRKSILELKFKNNQYNAEFFGELLFENISDIFLDWEIQDNFYKPILITVPLSFWRKVRRGYNQNDLIIESFMQSGGKNFVKWEKNILKKNHRRPQSKTRNKKERIENQKNAYKIRNANKIKNKNIIIFDDIYTSGATVNEIKKILKKANAKNIKIIVLSH